MSITMKISMEGYYYLKPSFDFLLKNDISHVLWRASEIDGRMKHCKVVRLFTFITACKKLSHGEILTVFVTINVIEF
jgi:hypothetical protein